MNEFRSISIAVPPHSGRACSELVNRCSDPNSSALRYFEERLRTIADRIRHAQLSDGFDFALGRDALRVACLPLSERRFIDYQLTVAKTYALGTVNTASNSPGAAMFHLRQILSRIKSVIGTLGCCGGCLSSFNVQVLATPGACCEPQIQKTRRNIGESQS